MPKRAESRLCWPMKRATFGGFLAVWAFAFLHAQFGHAAIVNIPNPGFEQAGNAGTVTGNFGSVTQVIGEGPWSGSTAGVPTLVGPTLQIVPGAPGGTDGRATISGLGDVTIVVPIMNFGEFFQVLNGVTFQPNTPYRLSVDVTTGSTLTLAGLTNSGIGLSAGTALVPGVFKSTTATAGNVTLVTAGLTGRLTFDFTTPAVVSPGNIRLGLYAGDIDGLTTINAIPSVTFDNVLFEIVPEPTSAALLLVGCLGLARRRRVARVNG